MAKYNITREDYKGLRVFPKILVRERNLRTFISLKGNTISELPDYFHQFVALQTLNLSENNFEKIPEVLTHLKQLKEIYFDFNTIGEIDNLCKITSLETISVNGNYIDKLPYDIVDLKNIETLNLSENEFVQFPIELCQLKNLKRLDLSDNQLFELSSEIKHLQNLTYLNLNKNQLRKLPPEVKELKKLTELHIEDNILKLPKDYDPKKPLRTIDYILKQQEFAKLKTTKAFVFKNLSKNVIIDKYNSIFEKFTEDKGIDIVDIENIKDITFDATVVFFIVCFDIHSESQLIYKLIDKCKKYAINYYILMEEDIIGGKKFINFGKGAQVDSQHTDLKKKFNINYYNAYDELTNFIFNAVNQRAPNIKFRNIELKNIGHFSSLNIPISENICCLVGENGTGKSTILKAIALAAIGSDFESIDKKEIYNLLKIEELGQDGSRQYSNGYIKLKYTIDGDEFINEINLNYNDETESIKVFKKGAFEVSTIGQNLKSLVLGFPQIRGGVFRENSDRVRKLNQPHIDDVIPLINDSGDNRLNSFGNWIVQLYFDAVKKEFEVEKEMVDKVKTKEKNEIKEWAIINKAFEIISSFSDYKISFKTVETGEPPVVWVKTVGAPNGIPLDLISQGFKVVMGWLGYFIQRLIESYPVQTPSQAAMSHAVLFIDEIDTYIHPKWQTKILNILRKTFPNSQFILSTHSPIAISSCNDGEVVVLNINNNEITCNSNFNTKGWLVESILLDIMGVDSTRDDEVNRKIEDIERLLIKKYKNDITIKETKILSDLIKEIENLPIGDPIVTLLNLQAIEKSISKKN